MQRLNHTMRAILAIVALAIVAGCSTLSLGTANSIRAIDYLHDDIASLVLALDVPVSLVPLPEKIILNFDASLAGSDDVQLHLALVHADAGNIAANLPPPAQDRGYFLFGFSQSDKIALRQLQERLRAASQQNSGANGDVHISIDIEFCAVAPVSPDQTKYSVLVALPDSTELEPLIVNETLSVLLDRSGQTSVTVCPSLNDEG